VESGHHYLEQARVSQSSNIAQSHSTFVINLERISKCALSVRSGITCKFRYFIKSLLWEPTLTENYHVMEE
jgi:hypothetical protein